MGTEMECLRSRVLSVIRNSEGAELTRNCGGSGDRDQTTGNQTAMNSEESVKKHIVWCVLLLTGCFLFSLS